MKPDIEPSNEWTGEVTSALAGICEKTKKFGEFCCFNDDISPHERNRIGNGRHDKIATTSQLMSKEFSEQDSNEAEVRT